MRANGPSWAVAKRPPRAQHAAMNTAHLLPLLLAATLLAPAHAVDTTRSAADAMKAIETAIGEAPCEGDADCRVLGVGAKACGGPEAYLPWSVRYTQGATLERLADEHRALRSRQDRRDGRVSNCAVVPAPAVQCVARRCQTRPGPSAR